MKLNFIREQLSDVDVWTKRLLADIEESEMGVVDQLSTSINWQLGHIIISQYFHTVKSIVAKDSPIIDKLKEEVNIDNYFKYYFAGSKPNDPWVGRPNKSQLVDAKIALDIATSRALESLSESDLMNGTETGNPIAKTKYNALTFSFKHQMWHNGQIAMIKRIAQSQ